MATQEKRAELKRRQGSARPGPGFLAPAPEAGSGAQGAPALRAARPKVESLLEEFQADPAGEMAEMIRLLLLSQCVEQETQSEEALAGQLHQERLKTEAITADLEDVAVRLLNLEEKNSRVETALEQARFERREMVEFVQKAQADAAQGRPWDEREVYQKISRIIGLGGGLVERIEPGYRGQPEGG